MCVCVQVHLQHTCVCVCACVCERESVCVLVSQLALSVAVSVLVAEQRAERLDELVYNLIHRRHYAMTADCRSTLKNREVETSSLLISMSANALGNLTLPDFSRRAPAPTIGVKHHTITRARATRILAIHNPLSMQ